MAGDKIEVRMPLFDRLVDEDLSVRREVRPKRTLDRRGLKESVRRELEQLFNTRCPVPAHQLSERERSVINYGIPDLSHLSPANDTDRALLAEYLRQAIVTFEPRLTDVRISIDEVSGNALGLTGRIEASLITETVPEPVSFATVLQLSEGSVEVHAQPE